MRGFLMTTQVIIFLEIFVAQKCNWLSDSVYKLGNKSEYVMEKITKLLYEGVEHYPTSTNEMRIRNPFSTNMALSSSATQVTRPESK
jgi:hypothetical protein